MRKVVVGKHTVYMYEDNEFAGWADFSRLGEDAHDEAFQFAQRWLRVGNVADRVGKFGLN